MYNVHVDVTHCTDHANAQIYNILFLINRLMLKMEKHKKNIKMKADTCMIGDHIGKYMI